MNKKQRAVTDKFAEYIINSSTDSEEQDESLEDDEKRDPFDLKISHA